MDEHVRPGANRGATIRKFSQPPVRGRWSERAILDSLPAFSRALACLGLLGVGLVPRSAAAADFDQGGAPEAVEVHAFVSQGFFLTVGNDFISERSTDGSFEFTEIGVNFTKSLGEKLQLGIQLFAQDLGSTGDYRPRADWFYLDYAWRDWLGLRVGRLKIPYGLHNEIHDVDAARVPVLLPGSVYPLQGREILFAHSGAELYGFTRSRALGALDYRVFGGTIFFDSDALTPPGSPLEFDFYVPYVVGGRLLWETPLEGFRFGGSVEYVRLETAVDVPTLGTLDIVSRSLMWVGSAEYAAADLVLTAEYSRWHNDQTSNNDAASPPLDPINERAYAMATYRVAPWFHPGAYYAVSFPDTKKRDGRENVQHDLALTLRFDINAHWLVKLEGHYMNGTAGLNNPLSIEPPNLKTADRSWAAFFAKTTAHF